MRAGNFSDAQAVAARQRIAEEKNFGREEGEGHITDDNDGDSRERGDVPAPFQGRKGENAISRREGGKDGHKIDGDK